MWGAAMKSVKPDRIDVLGDLLDFHSVSLKFTDVPKDHRVSRIEWELKQARQLLSNIRDTFPRAEINLHGGNHEDRLSRYVSQHAKGLFGLECLEIPALLNLDKLRIGWYNYGTLVSLGRLYLTHGSIVRKHSGDSARANLDKYGVPVLCGHTHRGGAYYRRTAANVLGAWENFCMCKLDMPYVAPPSDWQHGWSVVHYDTRRFHVTQVPVVNYRYAYAGSIHEGGTEAVLTNGVQRAR